MVADYIDYFRQLAVRHKDLQHDPLSETGDGAIGSMHFTKISAQEVAVALNKIAGFPLLALELYETDTRAEAVSDVKLRPRGAFLIVDNPVEKTFIAEQTCFVNSERILFEILQKIWQDHYGENADTCDAPFKFFDFDKIEITPVSKVFSGQCGYRVTFDFELQDTMDLTAPPAPGTFI